MMIIHLEDKTSNFDRGGLQSFIWARSDDLDVERSSQAKKGIKKSNRFDFCCPIVPLEACHKFFVKNHSLRVRCCEESYGP